jgi:threonine dehydrogenase-like Zn-dependent dehydrogenase
MRALTVTPGLAGSHRLEERPEPTPAPGELLVEGVAVGVCGTDREIMAGEYGWPAPGADRLVIGHESLGRVLTAPENSRFEFGDMVVGVVRRPDPVPCGACAAGEFDMCRNGRYRERGIKELDGYAAQRWTVPELYAVPVDPALGLCAVLTEPASVVAKAWEQVESVGRRAWFEPRSVLVTGAGPIGLLAALMGVQRGLEVHVLDRVTDGPKPDLVSDLGASYHHATMAEVTAALQPDVVIEGTGVGSLVFDAIAGTGPYGIVCLTGVSSGGRTLSLDAGALNRDLVLENDAVVGSVNANQRHFELAAQALRQADPTWLRRMITRTVTLDRYTEALEAGSHDVKVVLELEDVGV